MSQEGVQQGDPLGPLLFSLTTLLLLTSCGEQLKFCYLDDFTLGGDVTQLASAVDTVCIDAKKLGLHLNDAKCELISGTLCNLSLPSQFSQFKLVPLANASLLGVPLSPDDALESALKTAVDSLQLMVSRLVKLRSQDALLLLRHSFASPCILHLLRGIYCGKHRLLSQYDNLLRDAVSDILNIALDDSAWLQASLPIASGGIGIRSTCDMAASAFLASVHGAAFLASNILGNSIFTDPLIRLASVDWEQLVGTSVSSVPSGLSSTQKSWDHLVVSKRFQFLLEHAQDD